MPQNEGHSVTNIIHCDLDAFFAAVEQLDNPSLRGKPVVVGGSRDSRGVVATCSYEARKFGIRSAMPVSRAYRLCPQAIFLPVNMPRYQELSKEVFSILGRYTPIMETISIDEAFLDVSCSPELGNNPERTGQLIRKQVYTEIGLTISVGISYNKFLAKLASDMNKPNGFFIIRHGQAFDLLKPLPVTKIWGVGRKTQQKLAEFGIMTIGDIQSLSPEWLENKFGIVGRRFWELAQGIDKRAVEPERERKSLGREQTFPEDTDDIVYLERLIEQFAAELCHRLRQEDLTTANVTIKLRYSDFKTITRSKTINPCNSDVIVTQIATHLLHKAYKGRYPLRLLGLSLGNLAVLPGLQQGSLFGSQPAGDYAKIDVLMDEIQQRFGPNAIIRANLLAKDNIDREK